MIHVEIGCSESWEIGCSESWDSDYANVDVSKFYADPYCHILSNALLREEKYKL